MEDKNKILQDINELVKFGVMKQSIAKSMGISKALFTYRCKTGNFYPDEVHKFYRKFAQIV